MKHTAPKRVNVYVYTVKLYILCLCQTFLLFEWKVRQCSLPTRFFDSLLFLILTLKFELNKVGQQTRQWKDFIATCSWEWSKLHFSRHSNCQFTQPYDRTCITQLCGMVSLSKQNFRAVKLPTLHKKHTSLQRAEHIGEGFILCH